MAYLFKSLVFLSIALVSGTAAMVLGTNVASAEALLLVDVDSGRVIFGENATYPWYPASVTKLMTTYVTLKAVRDRRINLDSVFTVSPNAVAQQPSKMGFKAGTQLTVDNTLKMMLVHSANDMAVVLAEGVSGSIEKFSDEMNAAARRLGMTQTSYVNPNGLPADEQITSARDLAILARALIREFPEYDYYWHIASIRFGKRIYRNTNKLIDAYPGTDGMKTGFICASGFNLVATAKRGDKRVIAVVLGASSSAARTAKAAQLLERGFSGNALSWLLPSLGTVDSLVPIAATPPNLRDEICGKKRHRPDSEEDDDLGPVLAGGSPDDPGGQHSFFLSSLTSVPPKASALLTSGLAAAIPPVDVYIGPARKPGMMATPAPAAATPARKPPPVPTVAVAKPVPAKPPAQHATARAAVATPAETGSSPTGAVALKPWPGTENTAASNPSKPSASKPNASKLGASEGMTGATSTAKPKAAQTAAMKPKPVAPNQAAPKTEAQ